MFIILMRFLPLVGFFVPFLGFKLLFPFFILVTFRLPLSFQLLCLLRITIFGFMSKTKFRICFDFVGNQGFYDQFCHICGKRPVRKVGC
jgi:hypothetical protein